MWRDEARCWSPPWDNSVRGGEQVAHSLWAFATGGALGTGLGLGDPQWMPAAHTDLILAALGEEWGFLGVLGVLALYAALVSRSEEHTSELQSRPHLVCRLLLEK